MIPRANRLVSLTGVCVPGLVRGIYVYIYMAHIYGSENPPAWAQPLRFTVSGSGAELRSSWLSKVPQAILMCCQS